MCTQKLAPASPRVPGGPRCMLHLQARGKSRLGLAWEGAPPGGRGPAGPKLSPSGEDGLKTLWKAAWGPLLR